MNIKKFWIAAFLSLILFLSLGTTVNAQKVLYGFHHVITTRAVYATKMRHNFKTNKDTPFKWHRIPTHTRLYIEYGGESDGTHCWVFLKHAPGIGNAYTSKGYWCIPLRKRKWFRVVHLRKRKRFRIVY